MNAQPWTIEDHLRDQPAASVALYRRVEEVLTSLGEVTTSVSKSTITFKGPRRGFAGARPTKAGVQGYFDIMRPLSTDDPRIRNVTPYQHSLHVHHYRLTDVADLDEEFVGWLREAYDVGTGAHLRR
ncbi:DUF5655 domain-containing protein [Phytoactinopolyspora endophytica]|uniref:DUF5655 domain-containing protein n=1 Tax=Phytoactinopolyspora endophytica TaxID=1642495 RepID=UPI00101C6C4A|nr:DUF5655 domain-containing protein [Phytoactinopolyspora endophytica]